MTQSIDLSDPLGFGEMPEAVSDIVVATMRLKRMFDADNARRPRGSDGVQSQLEALPEVVTTHQRVVGDFIGTA